MLFGKEVILNKTNEDFSQYKILCRYKREFLLYNYGCYFYMTDTTIQYVDETIKYLYIPDMVETDVSSLFFAMNIPADEYKTILTFLVSDYHIFLSNEIITILDIDYNYIKEVSHSFLKEVYRYFFKEE